MRKEQRRSATVDPSRATEDLMAIRELMERDANEHARTEVMAEILVLAAALLTSTVLLWSRSPLARAERVSPGHVVLNPPSPDLLSLVVLGGVLVSCAATLARTTQGVLAGVILYSIPPMMAISVTVSTWVLPARGELVYLQWLLVAVLGGRYLQLHVRIRSHPELLPISRETAAAYQVVVAIITLGMATLLLYLQWTLIPERYRGMPVVGLVGAALTVGVPVASAVMLRDIAFAWPHWAIRRRRG
jgi:hypothetical protein